jgi:3-methyladenine DNA glycosylase/8-oxoguanine DNA glycosylase
MKKPIQPDQKPSLVALKRDPHMAALIRRYGPPDLTKYHANSRGVFHAILRSIVYQQVSGHAAKAIHARVVALFPKNNPTPERLLKLRATTLRKAGLSIAKVRYVRDLAKKVLDGTVNEKQFPRMSSQEIIDHLVQIDGVGEWTAHMLLIFMLYRPDILPTGDLAIRKGFQAVYGLKEMPDRKTMERIAAPWRAHATAASWYLWRVVDEEKGTAIVSAGRKKPPRP